MADKHGSDSATSAGISVQTMEIVVALILFGLGGMVVFDSSRLGFRWVEDGPQAGYFPFYIGVFICVSSLVTLAQALFGKKRGGVFVEWAPLRQVFSVLVPAAIFVLGIQLIGIYVAAAAYIAVFMVWLGKYGWIKSVLLGVAVSAVMFMMFEVWFKVPLFKGGYNPLGFLGY
ncbi:MAG: tripartite tricarboxylate transporter TctB family protein [Betaproteobacteria bacterium]|nr:MAG: tripartite tricarboxylate transporter TctB family protein [Betaproteobacteria bacterium]